MKRVFKLTNNLRISSFIKMVNYRCKCCSRLDTLSEEDIAAKRTYCRQCRDEQAKSDLIRWQKFQAHVMGNLNCEIFDGTNELSYEQVEDFIKEKVVDRTWNIAMSSDQFQIGITMVKHLGQRCEGYVKQDGWTNFEPRQVLWISKFHVNIAQSEQILIKIFKKKNLDRSPEDPFCTNKIETLNAGFLDAHEKGLFVLYIQLKRLEQAKERVSQKYKCDYSIIFDFFISGKKII
jgi:hypothetical protein